MRKQWILGLVLVLMALPAAAQKVYIDYDQSIDFNSYKTFAWAKTQETSMLDSSALMHSRVKNGIEALLSDGGLTQVESDPDLYVTYHTDEKQEMQLNTSSYGYGAGGGWGWDPYWDIGGPMGGTTTTTSRTYTRGTLILDIWDREKELHIWRGTAEGVVPSSPEKAAKQIKKVVTKFGKKWDKMYKGN